MLVITRVWNGSIALLVWILQHLIVPTRAPRPVLHLNADDPIGRAIQDTFRRARVNCDCRQGSTKLRARGLTLHHPQTVLRFASRTCGTLSCDAADAARPVCRAALLPVDEASL